MGLCWRKNPRRKRREPERPGRSARVSERVGGVQIIRCCFFLNEDAESSQKRGLAGAASAAAAVGALMSSTDAISGAVRRNERRGRRFWTFLCLERQKKKPGLIIQDRRLCFRLRNYGAKITKCSSLSKNKEGNCQ